MITDVLHRIANHRQSLSREEARGVMSEVLAGGCTDAQIAALLVGLHMKGETVEEIVGFAEAIRQAAAPLPIRRNSTLDVSGTERDALVDTCGTGGDASGTFNISTATAMKYVQPARRELRLRTVFNLLGPLTNPARASAQVVGVYSAELVETLAEALSMLGLHRALVVHGNDGLDEITVTTSTRVAEVREGTVRSYEVTPEEFGFKRARIEEISGGDAAANAAIIRELLGGKRSARRDIVLLNAAAALVAAGRANHLSEVLPLAAKSIDSGGAAGKLDALVRFTSAHRAMSS